MGFRVWTLEREDVVGNSNFLKILNSVDRFSGYKTLELFQSANNEKMGTITVFLKMNLK